MGVATQAQRTVPEDITASAVASFDDSRDPRTREIMQSLVRQGVLKGVRGPRGGYRLAKERRRITAGEIVRIVAELEAADEPPLSGSSPIGEKVVRPAIEEIHNNLLKQLDAISIDDLCRRAEESGLADPAEARSDFAI